MIGNFIKKLIGKSKTEESAGARFAIALRHKVEKTSGFLAEKTKLAHREFSIIREKCKSLRETNYKLGLKHLENGHLRDAIFRFRFIKKFWPDMLDAHYQLAYCLTLNNKLGEAKQILEELLAKEPGYDTKARELLNHINATIKSRSSDAQS